MGPSPGVVHDDSGMCLLRDWMKTRHHFPIRKQAEVLLDCLCMNNRPRACLSHWRKEDSSLHGRHVGRVLGLTPGSHPRTLRHAYSHPQENFIPMEFLRSSQQSLSISSGLSGTRTWKSSPRLILRMVTFLSQNICLPIPCDPLRAHNQVGWKASFAPHLPWLWKSFLACLSSFTR